MWTMSAAKTFITIALLTLSAVTVRAESRCALVHDATTEILRGHRAPTLPEAIEMVGDGKAPAQVRKVLDYVLKMPTMNYPARVNATAQLFQAIRYLQLFTWQFEKVPAPDGEFAFVGDQGYFVLLKKDGRIFKGMMRVERDMNDYGEWNGRYDQMTEVLPGPTAH